ncbi:LCP family protein [Actinokineospora bangkokensis]|uniref:LytR family transcriptional regulator n=1 Tax=Actinokineospora bangkokensis TaxID=1193682 RepID=A0A1Q9LFU7_9PSEU|nr:LCP family protein [Actinokineospora bangkokensis]OLR90829.1 hypothetical protein BJP25_30140 [Actinokineospora bangkokensis]
MPDDHDRDGAPGAGEPPGGRRRAPEHPQAEPAERTGRRRRSLENSGGLSVSDLVERHSGSRPDLTPVAPPAPEPPRPTGRRGTRRHRTTTVPADILAQAQGQPVAERPAAPRQDDGIPTTVADLLGPTRAVPDAPRRARPAGTGTFPVDREAHPQPAAAYPPAPGGRRRAPEPEDAQPTGRRALPDDVRQRLLAEPTPDTPAARVGESTSRRPRGGFPTAEELEAARRALTGRRARPDDAPDPAAPHPGEAPSGRRALADDDPADAGHRAAPGDAPGGRRALVGEGDDAAAGGRRALPDGDATGAAPSGRRVLPDGDAEPARRGRRALPEQAPDAGHRAAEPEAGRRGRRALPEVEETLVADGGPFPADPNRTTLPAPGHHTPGQGEPLPLNRSRGGRRALPEPVADAEQFPRDPNLAQGPQEPGGTGTHRRPNLANAFRRVRPDGTSYPRPGAEGLPTAGPAAEVAPPNGTGAFRRPPNGTGALRRPGHDDPHPPGARRPGDSYPRPDAEGLPAGGTGALRRPGPDDLDADGGRRPAPGAEGVPGGLRRPGTGAHPRPDLPPNGTGAFRRPAPGDSYPRPDAEGIPANGTGAFRRPAPGDSYPRPGAEGMPNGRRPAPGDSYPRPDAEGIPTNGTGAFRRPAPGDSYPRPDAEGIPTNGTGAFRRPAPGDSYPRPDAEGIPTNGTGAYPRPDAGPRPGTGPRPRPGGPRRPDADAPPAGGTGAFRRPTPGDSHPRPGSAGLPTGDSYPRPDAPGLPTGEGPRIPRQQPPGQSSMPPQPPEEDGERGVALTPPPGVSPAEAIGMTTEMEPIGEAVQKRRRVDQTLARFSAVHDELAAEERARKAKKLKLNPFAAEDDEMDERLSELGRVPGSEPEEVVDFDVDSKSGPEAQARTVRTEAVADPAEVTDVLAATPAAAGAEPEQPEPEQPAPDEAVTEFILGEPVLVELDAAAPAAEPRPAEPEADEPEPAVEVPVQRDRRVVAARAAAAVVAVLVFAATGVGWGFTKWANDSIADVRALDPDSASITDAAGQRGDENFLLVGSDTREGATEEEGVGTAETVPGARSDTVMVAHVPADRSRVVVVSFPRDLEIKRPDCERFDPATNSYTGEVVPGQKSAKMNTAYQFGGPLCMTKVVQELSGLQITRFIGINFEGFKGMVDAVDGVDVCVEKPMFDTLLNTWIVKDPGTDVLLKGDQALNFVRARHVKGDPTSDYGRIKRQQRFLSSLLRKAMSGNVLLDPGKLTSFTGAFARSTFGDGITLDSLLTLGRSLQGLQAGKVTFVTVPTTGYANDRGNEVLRADDNKALFAAVRGNQSLPGEQQGGAATPQPAPLRQQQAEPVDPKTLKIQVLNGGSTIGGIARRTAESLTGYGFTVVAAGASPVPVQKTTIRYGKGHEAQAQALASAVPSATLELDQGAGSALVLVLGPEFDGKVVKPGAAGGTAPPAQEELPGDLSTVNAGDVTCA